MLTWQIIFLLLLGIQLFYALVFFLNFSYPPQYSESDLDLTVILATRNDEMALRQNLDRILQSLHGDSECIVVDDYSEDGSWEYLQSIGNPRLRIFQNTDKQSKKSAIRRAVSEAKFDRLLFTDADCQPKNKSWSRRVASVLANRDFALLYAPYYKAEGFLNSCIQAETFFTALQYLSYARFLQPYMGVGRNMGVRQEIFENKMPEAYENLPYGDDDLLVSAFAKKKNTGVCFDRETFVYSEPKRNWNEWMNQKKRHLSTGKFYTLSQKLMLGLFPLSLLFMLLIGIGIPDVSFFLILIFRYIIFSVVYSVACYRLDQKKLWILFFFWEWLWLFYLFVFSPYIFFKTKNNW